MILQSYHTTAPSEDKVGFYVAIERAMRGMSDLVLDRGKQLSPAWGTRPVKVTIILEELRDAPPATPG